MHPRDTILEMGRLYLLRGEPVPLDILARADQLGLSLADFGEPAINHSDAEGDNIHGTDEI